MIFVTLCQSLKIFGNLGWYLPIFCNYLWQYWHFFWRFFGNLWQSLAIFGNPWQSFVIFSYARWSLVIFCNNWQSLAIFGNVQWPLVIFSDLQWSLLIFLQSWVIFQDLGQSWRSSTISCAIFGDQQRSSEIFERLEKFPLVIFGNLQQFFVIFWDHWLKSSIFD